MVSGCTTTCLVSFGLGAGGLGGTMSEDLANPILSGIQSKLGSTAALRQGQVDAIEGYYANMQKRPNIAIHLPTGYGKTLVGLAVADYRRRVLRDRPVWVCPTRQLVFQVIERAKELKIPASPFVGPLGADPDQRRQYNLWQVCNVIAVSVYERVFTKSA